MSVDANRSDLPAIDPSATIGGSSSRRHVLLVLLMLVAVFAFADLNLFALLAMRIKSGFDLSDTSIGILQGFTVNASTAIALVPVGLLVDRTNRVKLLMATAGLWSVFTLLTGLCNGFWSLFACRVIVGVAEAAVYPAAYSLIADLYSLRRRSLAVSVFLIGTLAGASAATGLSGILIKAIDGAVATHADALWGLPTWRWVFAFAAVPGVILFAALAVVREPARRPQAADTEVDESETFGSFLARRRALLWRLIAAIVLSEIGLAPLGAWLPTIVTRLFGVDAGDAAGLFGLVFGAGSLSGLAIGTALGSLTIRRRVALEPVAVMQIGITLGAVAVLALPFADTRGELAIASTVLIASIYVGMTVVPVVIMAVAPGHLRGRLVSLETLILLAAAAVAPPLVGWLSDHVFVGPRGLILGIAAVSLPCGLLAPVMMWQARRLLGRAER